MLEILLASFLAFMQILSQFMIFLQFPTVCNFVSSSFSPRLLYITFFSVPNYHLHDGEDKNSVNGDGEFISEIESDIDENEKVLLECAK